MQTAEKISNERQPSRLPPLRAERREAQALSQPSRLPDDAQFFAVTFDDAGITRKELAYEWHTNRQYVDDMCSGAKQNPIGKTRQLLDLLATRGQAHRIPGVLRYIAANFNVTILDAEQTEAFNKIVGGMKP